MRWNYRSVQHAHAPRGCTVVGADRGRSRADRGSIGTDDQSTRGGIVMATLPHRSRLEDWTAETPESINARLEGARAVQGQTRVTLGTMTVISMMMLIVTYNAYLSFDSGWAFAAAAAARRDAQQ